MSSLWQPLGTENIIDPYPMYDRLRREEPVYKSQTGEWILTKYDDVKRVLSDQSFLVGNRLNWFNNLASYAKTNRPFENIPGSIESFLLFKNPPEHTEWRKILSSLWPKEKDFLSIISQYIRQLLPRRSQEIDITNEFARPLAISVIGKILGLSERESEQISKDGFRMVKVMDLYINATDVRDIDQSAGKLSKFFSDKINNSDAPAESGLLFQLKKNKEIPIDQLVSLAIFLFLAGLETTSNLIALNLYHLAMNPGHYMTLKKFPEKLKFAQNELTRFDSPVQLLGRISSLETDFGGRKILKGDTLTLVIGAANRDPGKFINPNAIDFRRDTIPHLSFGAGIHYCLGDMIAKSEATLSLQYIIEGFRSIKVLKDPEWETQLAIRKINSLHMRFSI